MIFCYSSPNCLKKKTWSSAERKVAMAGCSGDGLNSNREHHGKKGSLINELERVAVLRTQLRPEDMACQAQTIRL